MRERIIEALKKVIAEEVEIGVTVSDLEEQGHYATNVAFRLAKRRDRQQATFDRRQMTRRHGDTATLRHLTWRQATSDKRQATGDRRPPQSGARQATDDKKQVIKDRETAVSPHEIAEEIAGKLRKNSENIFEKIEVAGGGFINFWLKPEVLYEELKEILEQKDGYGATSDRRHSDKRHGDTATQRHLTGDTATYDTATFDRRPPQSGARQTTKIQVEFVSANPTGPLTLANGRGGFLGDVLANVLEMTGYEVEREYYINDVGGQILTLGKSILAANGIIADAEEFYKGEYVKEWAKKNKKIVLKLKDKPMKIGQMAAKDFLKSIKKVLEKKAGIAFDKWTSEEKEIHKKKLAEKALEIFKQKGFVYEKDGAVWLKTTEFQDDKDRVLITSAGLPTYFLADGGHYLETIKRGYKRKINILGPDHYGYVKRIQAVAKILDFEKSEVIITQALRLTENGKEVKMSKRKGQFITFEELVDEVGADVARFFFLMVSHNSHMDFDMALAKEKSNKNPVYYTQYAFVRCASILRKIPNSHAYNGQAGKLQITNKSKIPNSKLSALNTNEDIKLMLHLSQFSEVIEDTANDYQAHRLTRYAVELARVFHNFYEKERIIGESKDLAEARLVLVQATKIVFENLFGILGISVPEKM